jgi:hypothetical protein
MAFQDVYKDVMQDKTLTKEQKSLKLKKIFDYASSKLLDQGERDAFSRTMVVLL